MAAKNSFDISTGADLQEVDNAVNQAMKEVGQRYDFKGTGCTIQLDRGEAELRLDAPDDHRMRALWEVLQQKLVRRGVPLKNVVPEEIQQAAGGRAGLEAKITQGLPGDTAKAIVKKIKDAGFKKVQTSIQGDTVRVTGASRDTLQEVIAELKSEDFGVELQFGNYRSG